ncbi:MAG: prepilin-type N-terminal cleavage/methylation domain-containing protein [Chthoniobacteraceae bacterium]
MVNRRAAFTLVELMVSAAVVVLLAGIFLSIVSRTSEGVSAARSQVDEFQQAQRAFEMLTQRIGQATLNNYWDSFTVSGTTRSYHRMSELRFACGPMQSGGNALDADATRMRPGHGVFFQATTGQPGIASEPALVGLENLVNTWGYFVESGPDEMRAPAVLPPEVALAKRVAPRLMELREPAQRLGVYNYTSGKPDYAGFEWFRTPLDDRRLVRPVVENVAALIILPKLTAQETERLNPGATEEDRDAFLAPKLFYHSAAKTPPNTEPARNMRNRLPATVEITMISLDATTVARLYGPHALDPLNLRDAFHDARQLRAELQRDPVQPDRDSLERRLIASRARYRLFTATVPIRAAQ